MGDFTRLSMNLDSELKDQVQSMAEADGRSLTAVVERLLREYVASGGAVLGDDVEGTDGGFYLVFEEKPSLVHMLAYMTNPEVTFDRCNEEGEFAGLSEQAFGSLWQKAEMESEWCMDAEKRIDPDSMDTECRLLRVFAASEVDAMGAYMRLLYNNNAMRVSMLSHHAFEELICSHKESGFKSNLNYGVSPLTFIKQEGVTVRDVLMYCDHVRQYFACKVNRRDIGNPSAYGRSEFVNYSSLLSGQIMNGGAF